VAAVPTARLAHALRRQAGGHEVGGRVERPAGQLAADHGLGRGGDHAEQLLDGALGVAPGAAVEVEAD